MPTVRYKGHRFEYPISDVLRLFYGPGVQCDGASSVIGNPQPVIDSNLIETADGQSVVETRCQHHGFEFDVQADVDQSSVRREVKRQLYQCLSRLTGLSFPWGSLTGIRPTLVAQETLRKYGDQLGFARQELIERWFVSPGKADLALRTLDGENRLLDSLPEKSTMVYVGVPFCPSRCAYCSFIARDALSHKALLSPYVDAVLAEARSVFSQLHPTPILSAVYLGGGTPTSLPDDLFERFLTGLADILPIHSKTEVTVEAGRPDTINRRKLLAIRDLEATRLCINPQTFNDKTLERIGRDHTADDTVEAFDLARAMGFEHINMDLIAGLPGETKEDFIRSVQQAMDLDPESITIHTLAIKRSSSLADNRLPGSRYLPDTALETMLDNAGLMLEDHGLKPYYLYRQKDVAGGLENTGFAKPGEGCLYNVGMMGDATPVIGLGSGAMSKQVIGSRVNRAPNSKDIKDYINRIDEMIDRKLSLFTND